MSAPALVACSRMYNGSPRIRALWDALFGWLAERAGVRLDVIAHAAPAPLSELWQRDDLGAVFMCGYPWSRLPSEERPVMLAAPVASAPWAAGRPLYASHIAVAADGAVRNLEDLASAVWGWTVRDSQSGYHAPRAFLAGLPPADAPHPAAIGPLLNPSGVIAALRDGRIGAGAIDAYAYLLLARHEPETVAGLRIVATTEPGPCPLLVASRAAPAKALSALRQVLTGMHESEAGRALLARLCLERFAPANEADYRDLPRRAEETDRRLAAAW